MASIKMTYNEFKNRYKADYGFEYIDATFINEEGFSVPCILSWLLPSGDTAYIPTEQTTKTEVKIDIKSIKEQILEEIGHKTNLSENEELVHECIVNGTKYRITKENLNEYESSRGSKRKNNQRASERRACDREDGRSERRLEKKVS